MATDGQFYWPSVGTFVTAYGQFFMAANTITSRDLGFLLARRTSSVSNTALGSPLLCQACSSLDKIRACHPSVHAQHG
jgi:hypothetical protein